MDRLALALLMIALPLAVLAQGAAQPADYAVVSIIGDRFTVADRNTDVRRAGHEGYAFPLRSYAIDAVALADAKEIIVNRVPGASVSLALIREPAVYEAEAEVLAVTKDTQALVDALQPVLSQVKARKLVLISKMRGAADVNFENKMTARPGMLEGLGFYLDPGKLSYDPNAGRTVAGYIGVFLYFRISLIDQLTHRVLADEPIAVVETAIGNDNWESLTSEQKVGYMKEYLRRHIQDVLPRVLKG